MNAKRDFIVGLTALIGLAGLAGMLLMFGELRWFDPPRYTLTLEMADAHGVTANTRITLNGVEIGRVEVARTHADPREGIELQLGIRDTARVPRDVAVSVEQDFIGTSTLVLTARRGVEGAETGYFEAGDRFRRDAQGMLDMLGSMIDERFDAVVRAARAFERLSETYARVGESIELLISPTTPEAVDAGKAEGNVASSVARLDAALADARIWLADDEMRGDAKASVSHAREGLEKLAGAVETWQSAAAAITSESSRVGEGFDQGMREFVRTTALLNETLGEIQAIAVRINAGEGTLGLMATNPDLYRSLNDAAIRLEKALRESQLLIEKYRKEGVPIQW